MNNPAASDYVRTKLDLVGVSRGTVKVRSRDSTTTVGKLAYAVRTEISLISGRTLPPRLSDRIVQIIPDLPGHARTDIGPEFIVVYWDGPS